MRKIWDSWKTKWQVETDRRMLWIFLVFALTGSLTVIVRKSLFNLMNIDIENAAVFFLVKIVAIFIVYQLLLFMIGTLMGEQKFVKWFIAKMNKRFLPKKRKSV